MLPCLKLVNVRSVTFITNDNRRRCVELIVDIVSATPDAVVDIFPPPFEAAIADRPAAVAAAELSEIGVEYDGGDDGGGGG